MSAHPDRRATGACGEQAARRALTAAGLTPLANNSGFRVGELDLVMRDADTVVFVEVRYRGSDRFGDGAVSVDRSKRRKLVRAAQLFLVRHPQLARQPCRFDVVALSGDPGRPSVDWIRNAFTLDDL
jgi:putative endonuclease